MSRASRWRNRLMFECPGCGTWKGIPIAPEPDGSGGPIWTWNQSLDLPTLQPSILQHGNEANEAQRAAGYLGTPRCHSFVTDGRIQFLDDCTHALRGQTVDLPELAP